MGTKRRRVIKPSAYNEFQKNWDNNQPVGPCQVPDSASEEESESSPSDKPGEK